MSEDGQRRKRPTFSGVEMGQLTALVGLVFMTLSVTPIKALIVVLVGLVNVIATKR